MSKVAHYLQEHLMGQIMVSPDARQYFATDGSVFSVLPSVIAYPHDESDVRKIARFTWQLAERGRIVPITARGNGTDQTGAALGEGVMMVFPAHMNRIVELDNKNGIVTVEPGINYGKLQQALITHGRFVPAAPNSLEYSTVGGAVANNASGDRSLKYGDTKAYAKGLRVVLANGEVIETGPLSKRELNKKLGLSSFEGEIYRALDALIEEHHKLIEKLQIDVSKNTAGYNLADVKTKNAFDLTPLFVGSQGTLGLITEITLDTEIHNPTTSLLVGMFDDVNSAQEAIIALRQLPDMPSVIEMVDEGFLKLVDQINPNQLKDIITRPFPKMVLLVEFDDNERTQKKMVKRAFKILEKYGTSAQTAATDKEKAQLWKLREAAATLLLHAEGNVKAVPAIEDGIVPLTKYAEYVNGIYEILKQSRITAAIWGHAGDANLRVQPHLDLSQVGDRQTFFRLLDDYSNLVIKLGGSTSGEHGDGRLRGAYLPKLYGEEAYGLLQKVKKIFDPYDVLNPGVKIDVTLNAIKPLLRQDYNLGSWYDHMPRS